MATGFSPHAYENLPEHFLNEDEGKRHNAGERSTHQVHGKHGIYMNVPTYLQERKQRMNVPNANEEQDMYMNLATLGRQSAVYMNLPNSPMTRVRYMMTDKKIGPDGGCPNAPVSMRQLGKCQTVPIPHRHQEKYSPLSTFTRQPDPSVSFSSDGFSNPSYAQFNLASSMHEDVSTEEPRVENPQRSSNIKQPLEEEKFWIPLFCAVYESLWGFWQDCSAYCISSTCVVPLQFLLFAMSIATVIVGILSGPFCPMRWELPILLMTLGSIRAVTVLLRVVLVFWNKARPSHKVSSGPQLVTSVGSFIFLILFFTELYIFFTSSPSFKKGDSNYCNHFFYYYTYCTNCMILGLMLAVAIIHGPTCVEYIQKRNG